VENAILWVGLLCLTVSMVLREALIDRSPTCRPSLLGNLHDHDDEGLVFTVHLTVHLTVQLHRAVHWGEFGGDTDSRPGTAGVSFPSVNHPSVNRAKLVLSQPLRLCE
jgi:hypothetical protein